MTALQRRPRAVDTAVLASLVLLAAVLRVTGLHRSYDVFVDEITYLRISQNVLSTGAVTLYGEPFYLHPPGFFLLQAGWLALTSPEGDVVRQVMAVRSMQVLLALVSLVLVVALVHLVAGRAPAALAGVVFAVDPFVMRIQSRNLLETCAMLGALAGMTVLVHGLRDGRPVTARRAAVVGVLFGLSVVTKETTAFVTVLPLAVLVLGRTLSLRAGAAALSAVVATYAPYPAVVALSGQGRLWWDDKTLGVRRLAGEVQLTGFNRPGSVSFLDRVLEQLPVFAPTYGLIALGACYCLVLWTFGGQRRAVAAWAGSAYVLAAYTVVRGTLEEQLFYLLVLPSLVVVCTTLPLVLRLLTGRTRQVGQASVGVAVAAALVVSAVAWVDTRRHQDDAYLELLAFLDQELVPGAPIGVGTTSETAQFVLDAYTARKVTTLRGLEQGELSYVLVSTKAVADGTVEVDEQLLRYVETQGRVAFRTSGRSVGVLTLYELQEDPGDGSVTAPR